MTKSVQLVMAKYGSKSVNKKVLRWKRRNTSFSQRIMAVATTRRLSQMFDSYFDEEFLRDIEEALAGW